MSGHVTLEEAQAHLGELISKLVPGEEMVITQGDQPVAKLVGEPRLVRHFRKPGGAKDKIIFMADDFDAPLEDFKEYME
jgi:antitoxin (DNA-binding transcriptional repressor) of toxin-antitoxin stability system